jgi:hypothetical protein
MTHQTSGQKDQKLAKKVRRRDRKGRFCKPPPEPLDPELLRPLGMGMVRVGDALIYVSRSIIERYGHPKE